MPHRVLILAADDNSALRARNQVVGKFGNLFSNCQEKPKPNTEEVEGLVYESEIARSITLDFKNTAKMTYPRARAVSEQIIEHLEKKGVDVERRVLARPNEADGQHYFSQGLIIR